MSGIVYGSKRLGVLVPSGNSVAETELRAMLPDDVTMLTTRLALRGSSEPELLAMLTDLDKAATLLGHAEPDAIAFHCTAVSTFAPHLAGKIRGRITAATGRTVIATADAILAAFRVLQARRVLLVTPSDVCFISCTAIRSAGLERSLGMPVITSNQVLVWHALRSLGIDQRIAGFGGFSMRVMRRGRSDGSGGPK